MIRFSRKLNPISRVDLIPMIDVVFQLVVFFMVTSTFIITPGIGIEFPASETAERVAMSRLVVTVVSEEEVYLNKEVYTLESLQEALEEITVREKQELKSVVLEGDRSLPYSLIVRVLDLLRKNGFQGVNLKMQEGYETQ
jgi:biopolymer transport protein ExbD